MVTLVGKQKDFLKALTELLELDYDAIEAYRLAIEKLKDEVYKRKLEGFLKDHERHVQELSALIASHGSLPPQGPDMKQHLLKVKVAAASLIGDRAILKAMQDNEVDTNTAYERLNDHEGKWQEAVDCLKRGFEDEKRHKAWLEAV